MGTGELVMKIVENKSLKNIEGIVKVEKFINGGWVLVNIEKNLVVSNSSTILRDLMFGDKNKTISKMAFGDMSLNETNDIRNVDPPSLTDMDLINQVYEKEVQKQKTIYESSPAIEYTCILESAEANGPNNTNQLIIEYGLKTGDSNLFSRKTRSGIYKDSESVLKFTWIIVFK